MCGSLWLDDLSYAVVFQTGSGTNPPPPTPTPIVSQGVYQGQGPGSLQSDPNGGMNGGGNTGTATNAEGDDLGDASSLGEGIGKAFREGFKKLLASAPFQPGSDGRQFFANAIRMIPGVGGAYSGYAAATGKDPAAGTCEGLWQRLGDGGTAISAGSYRICARVLAEAVPDGLDQATITARRNGAL